LLVLLSALQTQTDNTTSGKQSLTHSKHHVAAYDVCLQDELLEDEADAGEQDLTPFIFLSLEVHRVEQGSLSPLVSPTFSPSAASIILMSCFRI
jgi:hypothetical protein